MWRCMRAVIRVAIIACELAFGNMLAIVKAILNNWQNLPFLSLEIYTISLLPSPPLSLLFPSSPPPLPSFSRLQLGKKVW